MEDHEVSVDAGVLRKALKVTRIESDKKKKNRSPMKRSQVSPASGSSASSSPPSSSVLSRPSLMSDRHHHHHHRNRSVHFDTQTNIVSYDSRIPSLLPGLLVACHPLRPDSSDYFEVEIQEIDEGSNLSIGLVPWNHPGDQLPGIGSLSFGFNAGTGKVHWGFSSPDLSLQGHRVSRSGRPGDRIGCGIKRERCLFPSRSSSNNEALNREEDLMETRVHFFLNGKRIASNSVPQSVLPLDFFPVIALSSSGEEVKLILNHHFLSDTSSTSLTSHLKSLSIDQESRSAYHSISLNGIEDGPEEEWICYNNVSQRESTLTYNCEVRDLSDVGIAQSKVPIDSFSHYFQVQVIDVGDSGCISVGIAKNDIPLQVRPGCFPGSVALHLESGLLFSGSMTGESFGPKGAVTGDCIGCGVIFPLESSSSGDVTLESTTLNSDCQEEKSFSPNTSAPSEEEASEEGDDLSDSDKEPKIKKISTTEKTSDKQTIDVFFTRNGLILGQKSVDYPSEGFYPIIGLMSRGEKVHVDLHPLSG